MERELTQNWLAKTNWQTCGRNIGENNQWRQNETQEKLIKTEFIAQKLKQISNCSSGFKNKSNRSKLIMESALLSNGNTVEFPELETN